MTDGGRDHMDEPQPRSPKPYVRLGLDEDEWWRRLNALGPDDAGLDVSLEPKWHAHPALGISGHLHQGGAEPHVHAPTWTWNTEPISLAAYVEDDLVDRARARGTGITTKLED